jgi:hypothetical protein
MNYIENQLFRALPYPLTDDNSGDDKNGQISLKIHTTRGETNWLNVSPDQMRQIEAVLNQEVTA